MGLKSLLIFICLRLSVYCEIDNSTEINDLDNNIVANGSITPSSSTLVISDIQELSIAIDLLFRQIQLMNSHLDGLKLSIVQLKSDVKSEFAGMVEDMASLKSTISETEIDFQSTRNILEEIQDWSGSIDKKFHDLETSFKTNCQRHNINKSGKRGGKKNRQKYQRDQLMNLKVNKLKDISIKDVQADSTDIMMVDVDKVEGRCCNFKNELEKLEKRCISEMSKIRRPSSCADIHHSSDFKSKNGVYPVNPLIYGFDAYLNVYCDFETNGGGWTIFQRRDDFGLPRENFERNWTEYKIGFGDITREMWLGNDAIYALTNQEPVELRIELENFEGEIKYAEYSLFRVLHEKDHFRLQLEKYSGDAGRVIAKISDRRDAFHNSAFFKVMLKLSNENEIFIIIADSLGRSRGVQFSTKDFDNDEWTGNCAQRFRGGWWFNNCHDANLNGFYYGGEHESYADGINWYHWTGFHYSLKRTEMKIRPIWFSKLHGQTTK